MLTLLLTDEPFFTDVTFSTMFTFLHPPFVDPAQNQLYSIICALCLISTASGDVEHMWTFRLAPILYYFVQTLQS